MDENLQKELKYKRIYKDLREKILSYHLPPETQLLGIRELMKHYDVSYVTIKKALEELEKYNLIKRIQGQGIFVKAKNAWEIEGELRKLVGLIVTDMNIPFFRRIIKSIEAELIDNGYEVLIRNSDFNSDREKEIIQGFIQRGVEGIIMVPTFNEDNTEYLSNVDGREIPIVYIVRAKKNYKCNYVVPDDFNGVYKGIEYLINNNHRNIAYIAGELIKGHDLRFEGYKKCLEDNNIKINKNRIIYNGYFEVKHGYDSFNKLIENTKKLPSAVFCYTDSMAVGSIKACREHGISVPNDISFLSCNNDDISRLIEPELSTISVPIEKICKVAVNNLDDLIKTKNNEIIQSKLSMKLIKRNSVKFIERGNSN